MTDHELTEQEKAVIVLEALRDAAARTPTNMTDLIRKAAKARELQPLPPGSTEARDINSLMRREARR